MSGSYYVDSSNKGNVNELLDQAELYRDQALQYSNEAEASATGADSSEANALSSATNAASSASAAASSAANASSFSSSASSFATDAGVARDAAVVAKNGAQTAATNAAASATDAANSVTQATNVLSTSLLKANNLSDLQSVSAAKTNLGLNNVNNTSDANKPISTAQAAGLVSKDSSTGSAQLPAGTTAQRSPNGVGKMRYNTELNLAEVNNGTLWTPLSGYVSGPASSTDTAIAVFDGATGKQINGSGAKVNTSGDVISNGAQVGQSLTASNNFHWSNLLDGLLLLSRGNAGSPITDVMRVKADNSVEFPGGVASGVFGTGQTVHDVTASRAKATLYTNSTGKPIKVSINPTATANATSSITVNGVVVQSLSFGSATVTAPLEWEVPNGATYQFDSTTTIIRWVEQR